MPLAVSFLTNPVSGSVQPGAGSPFRPQLDANREVANMTNVSSSPGGLLMSTTTDTTTSRFPNAPQSTSAMPSSFKSVIFQSSRNVKEMWSSSSVKAAESRVMVTYRGNWWIRSNFVDSDTMPIRHRLDFKKAPSTLHRLKKAEDKAYYQNWSQSSSSSWWQWQTTW